MTTPIVIAFKEGGPVGDCSYQVHAGERLIIAPIMREAGRLSAEMGALPLAVAVRRSRTG